MNKKAAEILVKCGYAISLPDQTGRKEPYYGEVLKTEPMGKGERAFSVTCNPFADTLEGRRQADAIEDWLRTTDEHLWRRSFLMGNLRFGENHQWRLDRIKWCLEQLETLAA